MDVLLQVLDPVAKRVAFLLEPPPLARHPIEDRAEHEHEDGGIDREERDPLHEEHHEERDREKHAHERGEAEHQLPDADLLIEAVHAVVQLEEPGRSISCGRWLMAHRLVPGEHSARPETKPWTPAATACLI